MADIDGLISRIDKLVKAIEGSTGGGANRTSSGTGDPKEDYTARAAEAENLAKIYDKINSSRAQQHKTELLVEAATARVYKLRQDIQAADAGGTTSKKELKSLMNQLEVLEKKEASIRRSNESAKDLADSFGSIFSGQAPDLKGMLDPKNIQGMAQKLGDVAQAGKLSQMASQAAVAALFEYSKAAINLAIDLGDMEAGFMKATGANQDLARSVTESYQETRKFGATAQETSESAQVLFNTFTDFTIASENTRKSLTETSAVLAKMGISNQDFAKSIQISTKALGMSADQAAQDMLNLEKFAENLGVAPQQLAADFAGAGDMLAKMGQDGTKAFKDLAIVAKTTGMQMESILAITNKFDTFEGAAAQAGKLNAALGGNFVNAMDLMMATDPAERFGMIRDSILDAGLSFGEMSYYQKNFYKESLGLKDVNELALMMSGNIDLMAGATQQSEQSMIDAAKRARDMATMQEKLNMAFAQMIPIITPLIDAFSKMTSFIADNIDVIKPLLGLLIGIVGIFSFFASGGLSTPASIAAMALGFSMLFDSIEVGEDKVSGLSMMFSIFGDAFGELWDAIKGNLSPMIALFGWFGEATEENSLGLDILIWMMEALANSLMFPLKALTLFINVFSVLRDLFWVGPGYTDRLTESFARLGKSFFSLISPLVRLAQWMGFFTDGLEVAGYTLFEKNYASNFLEGIVKIANAFSMVAIGVAETLNPFTTMSKMIDSIGGAFTSIIGAASSFFAAITDPAGAENISKIGEAISAIPKGANVAFVSSMTALAAADTAAMARASIGTATNFITGNTKEDLERSNKPDSASRNNLSKQPQQITVNLMLDKVKLATIVKEINGESAKDAIAGRA